MHDNSSKSIQLNSDGISVVINTYNASEHLKKVMEGVKGFDQIVVCDMESTDNTLDIAREYGAKIMIFPKGNLNYVEPARMPAIQAADCKWVFVVDADEIVTPELKEYLYDFIKNPGKIAGLRVPRKNFIIDKFKKSSYPDYQLRFFIKEGSVWPKEIHTVPIVNGEVAKIPAKRKELALIHIPTDMNGMIDRLNRYTSAEVIKHPKSRVSLLELVFQPWLRFVKSYLIKGGWRYGIAGYINAKSDATYRFYRLAKTYEKNRMNKV